MRLHPCHATLHFLTQVVVLHILDEALQVADALLAPVWREDGAALPKLGEVLERQALLGQQGARRLAAGVVRTKTISFVRGGATYRSRHVHAHVDLKVAGESALALQAILVVRGKKS